MVARSASVKVTLSKSYSWLRILQRAKSLRRGMKFCINRVSNEQRYLTILYIPWLPGHHSNPQASLKYPESGMCHLIFDGDGLGAWLGGVLSLRKELQGIFGTLSFVSCGDDVELQDFDSSQ